MAMQAMSIMAAVRRDMPVSICPSIMSMKPFMRGTPGMRKSTLVAKATSEVVSRMSYSELMSEAAKAAAMNTK